MRHNRQALLSIRVRQQRKGGVAPQAVSKRGAMGKRARTGLISHRQPFVPPENWYEPTGEGGNYKVIVQSPGRGFRHVLTPQEVRDRLSQLPREFVEPLEVVQFSRMTRKKQSFPCYGMQWGATLYLYPIEDELIETYTCPPKPSQLTEAKMYGGRWVCESKNRWKLIWTEATLKDFYLNNILIHELGHLVDNRNSRSIDRERYAEWFAVHYGYRPSRAQRHQGEQVVSHHADQLLHR